MCQTTCCPSITPWSPSTARWVGGAGEGGSAARSGWPASPSLQPSCSLQVELQALRPFYREAAKSPFRAFPWKNGLLHFRFLHSGAAARPPALAALHAHRRVQGVLGIVHCPSLAEPGGQGLARAHASFEAAARAFPDASVLRLLAFDPDEAQAAAAVAAQAAGAKGGSPSKPGGPGLQHLMAFPPTPVGAAPSGLARHAEVVMLEFAAALLCELERWMLSASPAAMDLATPADADAQPPPPPSDEETVRRRRYGRLTKALGDAALLAGSPADALTHYCAAVDLSRGSGDGVWAAAALEGAASAKLLAAAGACGASRAAAIGSVAGAGSQPGTPATAGGPGDGGGGGGDAPPARHQPLDRRVAALRAADAWAASGRRPSSASSDRSAASGFGGVEFWDALRACGVDAEARPLLAEARATLKKRGGPGVQIGQAVRLARLVAGMGGPGARREVSDLAADITSLLPSLASPEDRLTALTEAAQVVGAAGLARKRALLLWQAIELCRAWAAPDLKTLALARLALDPPDDPGAEPNGGLEPDLARRRAALAAGVPRHWSFVRCGCLEGVLSAAIKAAEAIDTCLGRLEEAVSAAGGVLLITADHGNLEQMQDTLSGQAHTQHTTNPVPLVLAGPAARGLGLRDGRLASPGLWG